MKKVLFFCGIIFVVGGIVLSALSYSVGGKIFYFAVGVLIAILFFALSFVIEQLEKIQASLQNLQQKIVSPSKECPSCHALYDGDHHACPHCGHKEQN